MNRRGNYDEKPSYEELASALRYITYARQLTLDESAQDVLKRVMRKAKEVVDKLNKTEANQFKEVRE